MSKKKKQKSQEKEVAKVVATYFKEVYQLSRKKKKDPDFEVHYQQKSMEAVENIMRKYDFSLEETLDIELYCDDGPENKGFVESLLRREHIRVKKIIANHNTEISNNMIEHFNHKFKSYILEIWGKHSADYLQENIENMMDFYNNLYMPIHQNRSPNEVADGVKADDLHLKNLMELAQKCRIEKNSCHECHLSHTPWNEKFDCTISQLI